MTGVQTCALPICIRDLLEKASGDKLLYPPEGSQKAPTFRELTGKYEAPYPWLKFGIDLIMGSPGDKRATFREKMFLPLEMQRCLSETVINRNGKMIPLLQNSEVILDFGPPAQYRKVIHAPENIFSFILILLILMILLPFSRKRSIIITTDVVVFSLFSILALLMIFFNFFTDHQQMKWNLNIIWLNPFIFMVLFSLITGRPGALWFRIVFFVSVIFFALQLILPQAFNPGVLPLVLIMALRSSAHSGFAWNPFSFR